MQYGRSPRAPGTPFSSSMGVYIFSRIFNRAQLANAALLALLLINLTRRLRSNPGGTLVFSLILRARELLHVLAHGTSGAQGGSAPRVRRDTILRRRPRRMRRCRSVELSVARLLMRRGLQ